MKTKEIILSIVLICIIAILPHTGLIPNFGYSIPILVLVWLHLKYFGEKFKDLGLVKKNLTIKALLNGIILAIVIVSFMQLIFFPFIELFYSFEDIQIELYDIIRANFWQYLILVIMGWLIGGLYEEVVFHGFIFTRLEKMISGPYATKISFILTSIIFGFYHFQLGLGGLINALIVGAGYLAIFLYFKRNLWYSIVCHGTYNTIIMTLIYMIII